MMRSAVVCVRPRVIVCGGGASGYAAAISAKETSGEIDVLVLESASRPLRKVLASGGGRCNVMHNSEVSVSELVENYPRGKRELLGPFTKRFGPIETHSWFQDVLGVELKVEDDGRMFPITNDARSVASALEEYAEKQKIDVHFKEAVRSVFVHEKPLGDTTRNWVVTTNHNAYTCDAVVLSTGSAPAGYRIAQALDHKVEAPYPSLFSFRLAKSNHNHVNTKKIFADLAGISVHEASLRLEGTRHHQQGPLLITHNGLSGPCALRLSAFAARDLADNRHSGTLRLSLLPKLKRPALLQMLESFRKSYGAAKLTSKKQRPFLDIIPYRLWLALLDLALDRGHLNPKDLRWADLSKIDLAAIIDALIDLELPFEGKDTNKDEFVTAGGVSLSQVDTRTMASKLHPGLYFAGELLDVDAVTGGFNFQHCWTSGHIAGSEAAAAAAASSFHSRPSSSFESNKL